VPVIAQKDNQDVRYQRSTPFLLVQCLWSSNARWVFTGRVAISCASWGRKLVRAFTRQWSRSRTTNPERKARRSGVLPSLRKIKKGTKISHRWRGWWWRRCSGLFACTQTRSWMIVSRSDSQSSHRYRYRYNNLVCSLLSYTYAYAYEPPMALPSA